MLAEKTPKWYHGVPPALLIAILLTPLAALATAPTQIAPDVSVVPSNYQFALIGNSPTTYVKFGTNFYSDGISIQGQEIDFTNTAIGASSPPLSFGLNVQNANLTITNIDIDRLFMTVTGSASTVTTTFFYSTTGWTPGEIDVIDSTGTNHAFKGASILTDSTAFSAATAPAVYLNTASQYVQIKTLDSGTTQVLIYQGAIGSSSGGGGGGSSSPPPPPPVTTPPPPPVTSPPPANTNLPQGLTASISLPNYEVIQGQTTTHTLTVTVYGVSSGQINSVTFGDFESWFAVATNLPVSAENQTGNSVTFRIPISVLVSQDVQNFNATEVPITVTFQTGAAAGTIGGSTIVQPVNSANKLLSAIHGNEVIAGVAVVGFIVLLGVAARGKKSRRPRR